MKKIKSVVLISLHVLLMTQFRRKTGEKYQNRFSDRVRMATTARNVHVLCDKLRLSNVSLSLVLGCEVNFDVCDFKTIEKINKFVSD